MLAFSYPSGRSTALVPSGRLARYAVVQDYHKEIRGRLKRLLAWFTEEASPGSAGRLFVDTSPVLERLYARRAGLGWIGKNALLLSEALGSYLFLGGIATDRDLAPDCPVPDGCGDCTLCMKSCPTGALVSPRVIDAGRCIACWTIERSREPVPEPLRAGFGDRIFGCDACQEACPYNREPGAPRSAVFERRLPGSLPLDEVLSASPADFRARFAGTPVLRAGWDGLLRSALLAAGNSGDARLAPLIERSAASEDPVIVEQARWSLARILDKL
jgi:epoxyqueuosine reductase